MTVQQKHYNHNWEMFNEETHHPFQEAGDTNWAH